MLLMVGGVDLIVDFFGSCDFYVNVLEDLWILVWFDIGYYEIFNEVELLCSEVFGKMMEWLVLWI